MEKMEELDLQPYHWESRDVDGHTQILCWGMDKDSKSHLMRFENFNATCWLELPRCINGKYFKWNQYYAQHFYNFVCESLSRDVHSPIGFEFKWQQDLYYYQGNKYKPYMQLFFRSIEAAKHCNTFFSKRRLFFAGRERVGLVMVKVCEMDVPLVRKLLTFRDCKFSGWLRFTGVHPQPRDYERPYDDEPGVRITYDAMGQMVYESVEQEETFIQISKLPNNREWICDWTKLIMTPESDPVASKSTYPGILAYDIEVYSHSVRKFPDMWKFEDCVFMLSCVYQKMGHPETRKYHAYVYGDLNHISEERWKSLKDAEIVKVDDELQVIYGLPELVNKYDPEVLTGYNVYDFDNPYMDARLKLDGQEIWPQMGRLYDTETHLHTFTWESGGYGINNISELVIPGRITVDMLPVIRRDHKLLRYNLETVAQHFLNRGKHDVTPQEMFLTFDRNRKTLVEWSNVIGNFDMNEEEQKIFLIQLSEIFKALNNELDATEKTINNTQAGEIWSKKREETNKEIRKIIYARSFIHKDNDFESRRQAWIEDFEKDYTKDDLIEIRAVYSRHEPQSELLMHDNINDPANSPMYNRENTLNWCSKETWDYLVSITIDAIDAHELTIPLKIDNGLVARMAVAKFLMTRVVVYCLFDSDLCIELFEKLTVWLGLIEMASVVGVSPVDLFTRGQQIRCLSQLYDAAAKTGFILSTRESPDIYFNGGFVFDVRPDIYDGVMVEDFKSLYPSIMIAYNICYTTLLRPIDFIYEGKESPSGLRSDQITTIIVPRPDAKAKDGAQYDLIDEKGQDKDVHEDEEDEVITERIKTITSTLADVVNDSENYYYQYVNKDVREGLLPRILKNLLDERAAVRDDQKKYDKQSLMWQILEKRQLALKVSANSLFGFLGAGKKGKRPLIEGAMSITAVGRGLIGQVNNEVEKKYGCKVVYGDSVTPDTPILCRLNGTIDYYRIDELPSFEEWVMYHGDKEQRRPVEGLEVWSDTGFTRIKMIIRHKSNKNIYRISTHTGTIKVTEDHSLLKSNGDEIRPADLNMRTILMHRRLPRKGTANLVELDREVYHTYNPIEAANIFFSASWKNIGATVSEESGQYTIHIDEEMSYNHYIQDIRLLGSSSDFVYDLETENHHFAAGIGQLVVHNTDSSMFSKAGIPANEYNAYGKMIGKEMTKTFRDPLELEFEKTMRMLALARKKYAGYVYKDDGSFYIDSKTGLPELYIRGNVLARRDNAKWLRETFEKLLRMALEYRPVNEALLYLVSRVDEFMNGELEYHNLVTVRSVSAHYKNQTYFMKLFADRLNRQGMPVRPGERIGYLVVKPKTPQEAEYVGNRMVTPQMFVGSKYDKQPHEIDRLYYLEKQFCNALDQLFWAGYQHHITKYDAIKFRKSTRKNNRAKYWGIDKPVSLMVQLLSSGRSLDDFRQSIIAIDKNDHRGPHLSLKWEHLHFTYPTPKVDVEKVRNAILKARANRVAQVEKKETTLRRKKQIKSPPIPIDSGQKIATQFK